MILRKTALRFAVLVPALAFAGSFLGAPLHGQQRQALQSRVTAPAGIKPVGRLPGSQRLRLALTLPLRNQPELQILLHDLYDPASAKYRHFLSVQEFTEQFGPTADDYKKVADFATSHGLVVVHTSANRLVLDVTGPVAAIEKAFGVTMQVYQHPTETRRFFAPSVEPSVDASLPVQGVEGLSDFEPPHPADLRLAPAMQSPTPNATGSGPNGAFVGNDLRAAYAPGVTLDGSGQTVGIVEFEPYTLTDVQTYFNNAKQPLKVPIVAALLDGITGECGTCNDSEANMDIELVIAMAPNLSGVIVYEGLYPVDILNEMATDNIAKQLSCSYVWGFDANEVDPIFQQFAVQGQNFFTSSADAGATTPLCSGISFCNPSRFPSVDPNITSVGGTVLTSSSPGGPWQSETAWPLSSGGVSSYSFPIPSYQLPLINASNQGSTTTRNYPDVAAIAQSVYFCANGGCAISGGTSASAPVWAGFLALVNQQASGTSIGFLNPTIYTIAQGANYPSDFHDTTTGNNFNPASPNLYSAVPGYDLVTGLGSPSGQNLITALAPPSSSAADFTVASSPSAVTITPGGQATVTVTVAPVNGFAGTVTFRATFLGLPTGITASFSPASVTGTGSTTVTLSLGNVAIGPSLAFAVTGTSGGLSHTTYVTLSVLMPSLVETTVSGPPASVKAGDTFSVTDTTQNTGQAAAAASVTGYYLSATTNKTINSHALGTRTVPALATNASSTGTVTVTVPSGLWPRTPYHLVACANDTGAVVELPNNNCVSSSATAILLSPAPMATTTTLALTSGGSAVTTVTHGSALTLTATVVSGGSPVAAGQVNFCDGSASTCADIHLLGTAQLTSAGTATLKFIPGIGSHNYRAVFVGTVTAASSSSNAAALTVIGGKSSSVTTIGESGNPGNYSLMASVTGSWPGSPTGQVSFLDTSSGNAVLGTAPLVPAVPTMNWTMSQSLAVGSAPSAVALADFNGDGIPDLAITNFNDCNVAILLGNGDGTFVLTAKLNVDCYPTAVTVGDFNGDGRADLAVTALLPDTGPGQSGLTPGTVTILLGNGDGTFAPVSTKPTTGISPRAIEVGDFNGDGKADLAVVNFYPTGTTFDLTILLGNGDGTFTAAAAVAPGSNFFPYVLAAGDFNGDGKTDLAVGSDGPNGATILLGNGDGTFTPTVTADAGGAPFTVVTGDFNGDGKLDLAIGDFADNTLRILLGNGDGTFKLASKVPTNGVEPFAMAIGDFNGDGVADVAVTSIGSDTLAIFVGNGDGTFTAAPASPQVGIYPLAIAAGDFTGDGKAGLAVVNKFSNTMIFLTEFTANATANGVSPVGSGSHLVDASYAGDSNYNSSVSGTVALTASQISLSPRTLTFAGQIVGATSASQAVTLSNGGSATLNISSIAASTNFSATNNCGNSLAANSSCTINVKFAPTTGGSLTGTITVTDDANGTAGSTQTVALSGTGEDFSFSAAAGSSLSATVAQGQTVAFTLNLGSQGGLTGSVSLNITGAPSESTCTASPNPASLGTAATISCTTTRPAGVFVPPRLSPPSSRRMPAPFTLWILASVLLVACWTLARRRKVSGWRAALVTASFAVSLLLVVVIAGCGGGAAQVGPPPNPGTPAGVYPMTLTGTFSSGGSNVSHTITLTLTVTPG